MTDYSKIDFSKLKLPECESGGAPVQFTMVRSPLGADMCSGKLIVASLAANDPLNPWRLHGMAAPIIEYVQHVLGNIKLVDAFIAAELKRIAEEALPPWRDCTKEEARANPDVSEFRLQYGYRADWRRMDRERGVVATELKHYRTRAPKQEPKPPAVKATEGLHWAISSGDIELRGNGSISSDNPSWSVPCDKRDRDAMLARVAAFDLEHGLAFDINRYTGYSYAMERDSLLVGGKRFRLVEVSE